MKYNTFQKRDSDHLDSALEGKDFLRNLVKGEKKILEQISNVTCILTNLNVVRIPYDTLLPNIQVKFSRLMQMATCK